MPLRRLALHVSLIARPCPQTPRLAPGDYGDVLRRLKIVISKDSNVACVIEAVACCGALAKGLRQNFSTHARSLAPVLLDK